MMRIATWLRALYTHWSEHRIASLSAALAYYTLFSLAPILLISISIAGTLFGEEAARGQVLHQIEGLLGKQVGLQVQEMLQNAHHLANALYAHLISILILLFGASGVFSEIQGGLNTIWGTHINPNKSWVATIKSQFLPFAMVLICAFLLLISLVLSASLAIIDNHLNALIELPIFVKVVMSDGFSFFMVTLLFAMMFKYLPDVNLKWSDVWVGALITSLLFSLGKIVIGYYLKQVHIASIFGAAGSLIVLLLWIYYSAQIFFIGAEITRIYSAKMST